MELLEAFAINVRRYRSARGLTQAQLAEQLGVTGHTIFHYETGARWPHAAVMVELAKALQVRPWQLLADEGEGGMIPPELLDAIASAARLAGLLPKE